MSDPDALVEKVKTKYYPCPVHRGIETSKKLSSDETAYLIHCPLCGCIGRVAI